MKKLLLLCLLVAGCAGLIGQEPYEGPSAASPVAGLVARRSVDPCGPYLQARCLVVNKDGYVINPTQHPVKVDVECDDLTMVTGIDIQPRTTQWFSASKRARKCQVTSWQFLYP